VRCIVCICLVFCLGKPLFAEQKYTTICELYPENCKTNSNDFFADLADKAIKKIKDGSSAEQLKNKRLEGKAAAQIILSGNIIAKHSNSTSNSHGYLHLWIEHKSTFYFCLLNGINGINNGSKKVCNVVN